MFLRQILFQISAHGHRYHRSISSKRKHTHTRLKLERTQFYEKDKVTKTRDGIFFHPPFHLFQVGSSVYATAIPNTTTSTSGCRPLGSLSSSRRSTWVLGQFPGLCWGTRSRKSWRPRSSRWRSHSDGWSRWWAPSLSTRWSYPWAAPKLCGCPRPYAGWSPSSAPSWSKTTPGKVWSRYRMNFASRRTLG